jgi:hypothetical protein
MLAGHLCYLVVCRQPTKIFIPLEKPANISCSYKTREQNQSVSQHSLGAIYISRDDVLYYSNMSTIDPWERTVHCLFCNSMATLKPTKTRRIMLRCNTCGALVFANGIFSQQRIKTLKDFVFRPIR